MRQRMMFRLQKMIKEITFGQETQAETGGCSYPGCVFRSTFRKIIASVRVSGQVFLCVFALTSVCLGQASSSGLAAPVPGSSPSPLVSAGSKPGTSTPPKTSTSPSLSGSPSLTSSGPQLTSPGPKPSATPAPSGLSGRTSSGTPGQMRMSPNAAPKSTTTTPLAAPAPNKPQSVSGSGNPLAAPGLTNKTQTPPAQPSPASGAPRTVPAAVPGKSPVGVPAAKVPNTGNSAAKRGGLASPARQSSTPTPVAPKPKPIENPIIVAMVQKPAPGTSSIVGTPLSVNDLLKGISNPRQRHVFLNAYWTLTQKLGVYNIRVQHANDVNACIQQHSPAPTGNILVLLRSAQLLAVQRVKEAELDFIQAQFRFANTITDGRLRLTESNYFAGVSSEKEKEILTKTLSIPADPPTTMEYNTRLKEIATTRGASGTAKTLGITIPLQYGIVKSRLDESTQAYDNLLKLFRTAKSSQELVLTALDNTTRAKIDMFEAVIEYNRMIAAYVAETVAASVRGADLMATLNQYAEETVPVKQVRFDSTRTQGTQVPSTFAPSTTNSVPQPSVPNTTSSYNNVPVSPPSSINTAPSSWSPSSVPSASPELPAGYGTTQPVPGASLSTAVPGTPLLQPGTSSATPSYGPPQGPSSPTLPLNNSKPQSNIGTGSPIYAVDSIIDNANGTSNNSSFPVVPSGTPANSGQPFLTPPASSPLTTPQLTPGSNENGPMPFTTNDPHNESPANYSGIIIRGQAPLTPPGEVTTAPAATPNSGKTPAATAQDPLTTPPAFPAEKQLIINELVRALFPVKAENSGAGDSPILEIPLTLRKAIERAQGNSVARLTIVESYWKLRSRISELEVENAILESCQLVYSSFEKEVSRGAGASNPELTALIGSFKAAISAANARIYQARINIRYSQIELMQKMGQTTDTGWPVPSSYPYCGPSYRLEIDKARRNNFTLATESVLIPEKLKTIQMIGMALGPVSELFRPNISSLRTTNDGYLYLKTLENKRDSAILFIQLIESLNSSIVHYVSDFTDMPISNDDFIQSLVGPEK